MLRLQISWTRWRLSRKRAKEQRALLLLELREELQALRRQLVQPEQEPLLLPPQVAEGLVEHLRRPSPVATMLLEEQPADLITPVMLPMVQRMVQAQQEEGEPMPPAEEEIARLIGLPPQQT